MSTSATTARPPSTEILDAAGDVEVLKICPDGKGQRRFQMLANSGTPVERSYGQFVIDLRGIKLRDKIPMLVDHDGAKIAGYADDMKFTDQGLMLEGCLSKATEHGVMVAALSDEGFPWQASVGLKVLRREEVEAGAKCEVNGFMLEGPMSIARESYLAETSFLYAGADSSTYAVALSGADDIETSTPKEALVADNTKEALKAFREQFPGNEELATQAFLAGKSATDLKLELAALDREALTAAKAQIESLIAERDSALEELATLKALDAEAGEPGAGFSGKPKSAAESLSAPKAPSSPKEAWEASEALRAEFPNLRSYEALCRREGFDPKEAL